MQDKIYSERFLKPALSECLLSFNDLHSDTEKHIIVDCVGVERIKFFEKRILAEDFGSLISYDKD